MKCDECGREDKQWHKADCSVGASHDMKITVSGSTQTVTITWVRVDGVRCHFYRGDGRRSGLLRSISELIRDPSTG